MQRRLKIETEAECRYQLLAEKKPLKDLIVLFWCIQGAKKIIFTACHSGKLKLALTSPDVISTSPQNLLTSRIDFTVLLLFKFLKKHHLPVGKLKTEFTSPITKSTSPRLLDTTFFGCCYSSKETAFDKYWQSLLLYYLVSATGEFEIRSVVPWGPNTLNPIKCIKI